MSSKLKYLKRYGSKKDIKKKKASLSNFRVVDDDVNWRSTVADGSNEVERDDDSDEAPLVAEVHDESKSKWQPLPTMLERNSNGEDLSPPRRLISSDFQHDNREECKPNKRSFSEEKGFSAKKYTPTEKSDNSNLKDKVMQNDKKQEFMEWGRG